MQSIGVMLNTISASMRTEELLKQSQSLTAELQSQQLELKQTNDELEEKARLLQERNAEVERRTREIEEARAELERKAEQLSLTSKYKSQFLANMSHELRTPLNSLLILSRQLADNPEGNMSPKQVEFAQTIRGAGHDLLTLINDILDLSKIESGTTAIDLQDVGVDSIETEVRRTFNQIAADKKLEFIVSRDEDVPETIVTDPTRLQQILKNLLSNAFKFTGEGAVTLHIEAGARPVAPGSGAGRGVCGYRYRHRDPERQVQRDFRGVPASRHGHVAQIRRHGPGLVDQSRDRGPARRRDRRLRARSASAARSRSSIRRSAPAACGRSTV